MPALHVSFTQGYIQKKKEERGRFYGQINIRSFQIYQDLINLWVLFAWDFIKILKLTSGNICFHIKPWVAFEAYQGYANMLLIIMIGSGLSVVAGEFLRSSETGLMLMTVAGTLILLFTFPL